MPQRQHFHGRIEEVMSRDNVMLGEGRLVSEPSDEAPCPFHPEWHPPRRLPTQPRSPIECPRCREEQVAAHRRQGVDPVELAHPQYPRADGRMAEAWADYQADHKDDFIARGACAAVDKEIERRAIDHIDDARWEELADLAESPTLSKRFKARMKRHRKYWRRNY
jgi:hypothetical protein